MLVFFFGGKEERMVFKKIRTVGYGRFENRDVYLELN